MVLYVLKKFEVYVYIGIKNKVMSEINFTPEELLMLTLKKGNYQNIYKMALKALDEKYTRRLNNYLKYSSTYLKIL